MRTTVRIEDDLLDELKARAARQDQSLAETLNETLRRGLDAPQAIDKKTFVQRTYSMGVPRFDVNKALSVAADLEDEYIMQKMAHRR